MVNIGGMLSGIAGGATVAIIIQAVDEYSAEMRKAGEATKKVASFSKIATGAAIAAGTAIAATLAVGIQQALEYERIAQRTSFVFGESTNRIIAASKALSEQFAPTNEQILAGFNEMQLALSGLGVTADHQMKLMQAALNISAASGKDLNEVITDLIRGVQGNTRGLKEYGIIVRDGASSQDIFNMAIAKGNELQGAAQKVNESVAGKVANLTKQWNDFTQEIGTATLPVLNWLVMALNKIVDGIKWAGAAVGLFIGQLRAGAPIHQAFAAAINDTSLLLKAEEIQTKATTIASGELATIQNAVAEGINASTATINAQRQSLVELEAQAWKTLTPLEKLGSVSSKGKKVAKGIRDSISRGQEIEVSRGVFVRSDNPERVRSEEQENLSNFLKFRAPSNVNDFILTKKGQLIKTNPSDTIMGVKHPDKTSGNVSINITAYDSREVADKVSRILADRFFVSVSG